MAVHGVHRKAAAFPHAGSVLVCNPVYGVSADAVASLSHHSIMSSRAVLSKSGNALPRRDALVRIPRQARALKKYFSGTSTSKICDKSDSFATLGDSPMLSVKLSPSQAPSVSDDCSCVFPALPPPPEGRGIEASGCATRVSFSSTVRKSSPPLELKAPGTFSQTAKVGYIPFVALLISPIILTASTNSTERSPPNPSLNPAIDKS